MDKKSRKNNLKRVSTTQQDLVQKNENSIVNMQYSEEFEGNRVTKEAPALIDNGHDNLKPFRGDKVNIRPDRCESIIVANKINIVPTTSAGENNLNMYPKITPTKSERMSSRPDKTSTDSLPSYNLSNRNLIDIQLSTLNVNADVFTPKYYPKIESSNNGSVQNSKHQYDVNSTDSRSVAQSSPSDGLYQSRYSKPFNDTRQRGKYHHQNNMNRNSNEGHKSWLPTKEGHCFDNTANWDDINPKNENWEDGGHETENKNAGEKNLSKNRREMNEPYKDDSRNRNRYGPSFDNENKTRKPYHNLENVSVRDKGRKFTEKTEHKRRSSRPRDENERRDRMEGQKSETVIDEVNHKNDNWKDGGHETENKNAGEKNFSKNWREMNEPCNDDSRNRKRYGPSLDSENKTRKPHHNRENVSVRDKGRKFTEKPEHKRRSSHQRYDINHKNENWDDEGHEGENKYARERNPSQSRREMRQGNDDTGRKFTEKTEHDRRSSRHRYENETRNSIEGPKSETYSCNSDNQGKVGEKFERWEDHNEAKNESSEPDAKDENEEKRILATESERYPWRNFGSERKCKTRRSEGESSRGVEKKFRENRNETRRYSDSCGNKKSFNPIAVDEVLEGSDVGYTIWLEQLADYNIKNDNKKLEEREVDLFTLPEEYALAHCVAADMSMGSGIALQFRSKYKRIGQLLDQRQETGGLAVLNINERYVYYLVTKELSYMKPTYLTMYRSLVKLKDHMAANGVKKLAIPRIGCGLDRLGWTKVKSLITYVFEHEEVEIVVCNFEENADQAGPPKVKNCKVVHVEYPIEDIDSGTIIIYLASLDNYMSEEMVKLNEKFNFFPEFKTASKELGEVIFYEKNKVYILCGCIVKQKQSDAISFQSLEKCIANINKRNHKQYIFNYVGFQVIDDEKNTPNYSVINLLRNGFRQVDIYICWPGDFKKLMPIERNVTSPT